MSAACLEGSLPAARLQRRLERDRFTRNLSGLVGAIDDPPRCGELGDAGGAVRRQMPRQRVRLAGFVAGEPALLHALHHDRRGDVRVHGEIEVAVQASAERELAVRLLIISLPRELDISRGRRTDNTAGACAASSR